MIPRPASAAPRLFCILARQAPVAAVLRRGPTEWWQVGRWDLERLAYEPGAWFRGTLYPQKCDLSSDGRWLAYSAMKPGADWLAGEIYEAISRLPWLTALAAWEAGTTYTRGIHFDNEIGVSQLGKPDVGSVGPALLTHGLKVNQPVQFAVERRSGWTESETTPPRERGDAWDERRKVDMTKPQPGELGGVTLHVDGSYAAFRDSPAVREPSSYFLTLDNELLPLEGVQWADWDSEGRLLVGTDAGRLEVKTLAGLRQKTIYSEDLATLTPDPQAAPGWAGEW